MHGVAKKRGALPALAEAPPASSGVPLAPVATGRPAPVNPAQPRGGADVAFTGAAVNAASAAARQKRPATPNSHLQAPAKAACTSGQQVVAPSAEQTGNTRRSSHGGAVGSYVRDNEVMNALRASFQQNPEGVARLLLQSLDKQFPGAMKEAAKGHNSTAAHVQQLPQQSHPDVAGMRRAVLHQLLQANPALAPQLTPAAAAAVQGAAPQEVSTSPDTNVPVGSAQPASPKSPNNFTAILMELQQCGASDQTIMHVLQTLMQQNHQTAPPTQVSQACAPQLSQALASLQAPANANLLASHQNLLLAALGHQAGSVLPRGTVPMSAALAAQMHAPQQPKYQPRAEPSQVPAASGPQSVSSSLPLSEALRHQHRAPPAASGVNTVLTQAQLAQILSGLQNYNRAQAANNQQHQPVSGS